MSDTPKTIELDIRPVPVPQKHPTIFSTFDALTVGDAMLLINDHDPVPLFYQFAAEYSGTFRWEYLEQSPELFRVRIEKGDFEHPGFVPSKRPTHRCATPVAVPVEFIEPAVIDTRPTFKAGEKPCAEINAAIAGLRTGQHLIVLIPSEPVRLYEKLDGMGFDRESRQLEDGTWRVEFHRRG